MMNDRDTPRWLAPATDAKVGAGLPLQPAAFAEGPTLFARESASDRGIASIGRTPTWTYRSTCEVVGARAGLFLRPLIAATCALLLLAGCGTDSEQAWSDIDQGKMPGSTSTDTTASQGQVTGASSVPDNTEVEIGEPIRVTEATPQKFVKLLGRTTILVIIRQPTGYIDEEVEANAKEAAGKFGKKKIAVLTYDAFDDDAYGDLPEMLGVYGSPAVAVVDPEGRMHNFWVGRLVTMDLIRRALYRAVLLPPAKVPANAASPGKSGTSSSTASTASDTTAMSGLASDLQ